MSKLQSVRLQRFKKIKDAPFNLDEMNVLVGANNSGKSSIIQGLHFGISILQSIELTEQKLRKGATSLNPTQLIYSPSESIYALGSDGDLLEAEGGAISVQYDLDSGESCTIQIRRGRARNINITVTNPDVAKRLGSLEQPFSIFSPGLAGIAKTEGFVSDGVLLRTLARGDANLVLRNILLRLWSNSSKYDAFLQDLHDVFPQVEIKVDFQDKTAENIDVRINTVGGWVPLELAGTGLLQATQILSYIHQFSPSIIVLDEPDSHLHPNNQRLLCALLRQIAEERETQVLLTTHSRHVVDALGLSSSVKFLWVRDATIETATLDDEIGVLMDIGALDVKERVGSLNTKAVVLTEDENKGALETILVANGFEMEETVVAAYYGATTIKNLRPLVGIIKATRPSATIIIHRDKDYLSEDEVAEWEKQVRALHVEPFLTTGTDVESSFINSAHLSELNLPVTDSEFTQLINDVDVASRDEMVKRYVNGRVEIERRNGTYGKLNPGDLAIQAPKAVDENPSRYRHGKTTLSRLRSEYRRRYSATLHDVRATSHLRNDNLRTIASKIFKPKR